jgi:hypothetical protein
LEPVQRKGTESDGLADSKILIALTAFPFQNVRTLASLLKILSSAIYDHLQRGNSTVKHLRWFCHTLDDDTKQARVEMGNSMLKMIAEARHQIRRYFLTGDQSWFFYSTYYGYMWLRQVEKAPPRERRIISRLTVMIIIFWSRVGFPVIDALSAGEKFTVRYFCDNIVPQIAEQ